MSTYTKVLCTLQRLGNESYKLGTVPILFWPICSDCGYRHKAD